MAERDRIARYFAPLTINEPGSFHLTDDAAVLTTGKKIVVTTDSVIAGIHVLPDATAAQIAQKLVRRNLSDLAAMGAMPWRYFLNLHTPALPDAWFAEFAATLRSEQDRFGMVLAGGDSTTGNGGVHATMTCIGQLDAAALLRSTVQVGDDVYVSGTIGDAALGLKLLQRDPVVRRGDSEYLIRRYYCPEPRLELGTRLHGIATSCIDISDGLLGDAQQLAKASSVKLVLQRALIPLSPAARAMLDDATWNIILGGGDDYELLFTAPVSARARLDKLVVTRIGTVEAGSGVTLDGAPASDGFEHR